MLLALVACAAIDTAAPEVHVEPPDRPATIYYVHPGLPVDIRPTGSWSVECHDPGSLVAELEGRLCSVVDGAVLDVDDDGTCDLDPPVSLAISAWD